MYKKYIKRFLDILLAIAGMPLLLLVLLIFAPIIHYTDKGPVFYNAPRLGQYGRVFKMFKLRSMYVNAPDIRLDDGSTYNAADDPRVTPVGRFLRKTSLDEAPQIVNVLIGDMSVVGPRPDLPDTMNVFISNESEKLIVRPGITGYCQAYYRNSIDIHERFQRDVVYAKNVSFVLDCKIMIKTIIMVVLRKGIYRNHCNPKDRKDIEYETD